MIGPSLWRAAGGAVALRAAWLVSSYAGVVLLARWFPAEAYGRIALALSLATVLGMVATLGLQTGSVRFIGQYMARNERPLLRGYLRAALVSAWGAAVAVTVLGWAAVLIAARLGWTDTPALFCAGLLLVPGFALSEVQSGIARSFGRVFTAIAPRDVLWRTGLIGLGFAATLAAAPGAARPAPFLLAAAALLLLLVLWQYAVIRTALPDNLNAAPARQDWPAWRRVCGPIWIASIATVSFRSVDVIVLAAVLPAEELGRYFAAARLAALVGVVLMSVNLIAGPRLARGFHAGDGALLQDMLNRAALLSALPAAALTLGFALFGRWALGLFGPGFEACLPVLLILSLGHLAAAVTGPCGLMLDLAGQERANTRIVAGSAALTVLGIALGGALFGAVGAAAAASLGLSLWNLRQWAHARAACGVDTSLFAALPGTPLRSS